MNLYELNQAYETALDGGFTIDVDTGEVIFSPEDLEKVESAYTEKLEACGIYLKNVEAEAKAIREEEKALAERRRTAERKAERLKAYMLSNMKPGDKVTTPRVALSLRKSQAVVITDESKLADEYCTVKTTIAPNKTAIKKAIKAGETVDGAALEEHYSLQVK